MPDERLGAAFVCAVAYVGPTTASSSSTGGCRAGWCGTPRGANGFGYDPIFVPDGQTGTSAELDSASQGRDQPPRPGAAGAGSPTHRLRTARARIGAIRSHTCEKRPREACASAGRMRTQVRRSLNVPIRRHDGSPLASGLDHTSRFGGRSRPARAYRPARRRREDELARSSRPTSPAGSGRSTAARPGAGTPRRRSAAEPTGLGGVARSWLPGWVQVLQPLFGGDPGRVGPAGHRRGVVDGERGRCRPGSRGCVRRAGLRSSGARPAGRPAARSVTRHGGGVLARDGDLEGQVAGPGDVHGEVGLDVSDGFGHVGKSVQTPGRLSVLRAGGNGTARTCNRPPRGRPVVGLRNAGAPSGT